MIPLEVVLDTRTSRSWRKAARSLPPLGTANLVRMVRTLLKPGDTFVDVGASNGVAVTLAAAAAVGPCGKVLAIEPDPVRFARLQENASFNELHNVYCLPLAASDESICATFVCELPRLAMNIAGSRRSIRVQRVDSLCRRLGGSRVAVVRINAPGSELLVLRGMTELLRADPAPLILCQISQWPQKTLKSTRRELVEFMLEYGYGCSQIGPTVISRFERPHPQVRFNLHLAKPASISDSREPGQERVKCQA